MTIKNIKSYTRSIITTNATSVVDLFEAFIPLTVTALITTLLSLLTQSITPLALSLIHAFVYAGSISTIKDTIKTKRLPGFHRDQIKLQPSLQGITIQTIGTLGILGLFLMTIPFTFFIVSLITLGSASLNKLAPLVSAHKEISLGLTLGMFLLLIILIVLAVLIMLPVTYALHLVDDTGIKGSFNTFKRTLKLLKGHFLKTLLFEMSFIHWHLSCLITAGFAHIYVTPYLIF